MLFRVKNSQEIYSQLRKVKSYLDTFPPLKKMTMFDEQVCMSNMDFYV
jgi:hypothetical protein